jgi:DNA-binding transcriptional MerR regulator
MYNSGATRDLSIGDVARATGLTESAIRAWERRHGFPQPARGEGGHRRYSGEDVEVLRRAVDERRGGASVPQALAIARGARSDAAPFAGLRDRFPELATQPMSKRRLTVLSHSIEDEVATRSAGGLLAGCFQEPRFFRSARGRWADMAAGAEVCFVMADFRSVRARSNVHELPLAGTPALRQEWALVWKARGVAAFLLAHERPGQRTEPDPDRVFDVAWGVDPEPTDYVARALVSAARTADAGVGGDAAGCLDRLEAPSLRGQLQLGAAIASRALAALPG